MRDLKNNLTPGKNSKNIQSKKTKGFGYQVLGFGAGGERVITPWIIATGGTITTVDTNYKVHTFTGDGTFSVSNEGNACGSNLVDYLVVAGGGGGGGGDEGGGAGAGGYRESNCATTSGPHTASPLAAPNSPASASLPLSKGGYPISVGAGGAAFTSCPSVTTNGGNSVFSTITSAGGGFGGVWNHPCAGPSGKQGGPGGSGGAGRGESSPLAPGGTGNTPPVSPAQGQNGGDGTQSGVGFGHSGGGGGGATEVGVTAAPAAGRGGAGTATCISSSPVAFSGGGGGGSEGPPGGAASPCGTGGAGNVGDGSDGTAGTVNTGGGGGSGGRGTPGNPPGSHAGGGGGSGKVVIRYKFQ